MIATRHRKALFFTTRALAEHDSRAAGWNASSISPMTAKPWLSRTTGPHPRSIHPRYAGDLLNAAFVSANLEALVHQADLWLHGHVHDSFDYWVRGCRVVANPLGYPSAF